MGNKSVLSEIGSLMWNHPYVSCSLLVFLTPPFFPILRFFSPLLISTALFVVALVTMGPHFEQPSDQDDDFLVNASEFKVDEEAESSRRDDAERDVEPKRPSRDTSRSTWSDWVQSCKESGISWVEKKLQNENWKGGSLNDDNVSILQEAFAHRAEEKPRVMTKLVTRRIPDGYERAVEEPGSQRQDVIPALSHSDSWASSDRSFERQAPASFSSGVNTRDLPTHNFFSPHPSFSRRHDSDVNPVFENVIPPPIAYDMPPLITGPASITAPLFKSLADDMDMSDDEDDHHHSDHEHLEVGESTVDVADEPVENLASPSDEGRSVASPERLQQQEIRAPESSLASTTHADPVHSPHEVSAPPANDAPEARQLPSAEGQSTPALEILPESYSQGVSSQSNEELHDVPELEDVLPEEDESREFEIPAGTSAAALPDEVLHDIGPAASEAPTELTSEVFPAPPDCSVELPPHVVERSVSLPVHGSLADAGSHESASPHQGLPPLNTSVPEEPPPPAVSLSHAISLPAALTPTQPIIPPPKPTDQEPLSSNTDLGTVTTLDHGKEAFNPAERFNSSVVVSEDEPDCRQVSTKAKLLNIEALCDAIPPTPPAGECSTPAPPPEVNHALPATTEEQVAHVAEKMKKIVEDSPSKKVFQPDAPQLQITPPSTKVVLTPFPAKPSVGAGRATLLRPPSKSFISRYSSSEDESGDEEIDLDSDVEVVGEDSDSDLDLPPPVKPATVLQPPPKPAVDQIPPPHTAVQA